MWESCKRGIDLGEAMRGAPVAFSGTAFVELDAGLMMGVISDKNGHENGRIEKPSQLERSETAKVTL